MPFSYRLDGLTVIKMSAPSAESILIRRQTEYSLCRWLTIRDRSDCFYPVISAAAACVSLRVSTMDAIS